MFEVNGRYIGELSDSQLRELTARLCAVELLGASLPSSAVTAGGDQRAADGGIDVRVALDRPGDGLNYVPRPQTGFQVKQERGFGPAKVTAEMKPGGQARPVLQELADQHGAYVIVSGREALADPALKSRLAAMRCVADGLRDGARLHLDFYDGKRIANWVNLYPAMVLWVLDQLGGEFWLSPLWQLDWGRRTVHPRRRRSPARSDGR